MASTKVVVFDVIYNSAVEGSGECTKRSTNISPRARQWRASGAVGPRARWRGLGRGGGRGGGPRARAEEGHGRARWRLHEEEEGGTGVTEGERTRWRRREEEEGGGVRRGRRRADRSAPGAGGYISERITPGARHQPGVKTLYSRCVLPTGSKGFFLAGHETAAHLYSQFRFPPVLSNSLVKYNRNAIVFVKYIVN